MQSLPDEIIVVTCNYIQKITDKRKFTQTCKRFNILTKKLVHIAEFELEELCNDSTISKNIEIKKFKKLEYINKYSVDKFLLELCYDSYFNLIPESYLRCNTYVVRALAIYGQIKLLKPIIRNGYKLVRIMDEPYHDTLCNICNYAVISGNLAMVKYVILHGCQPDKRTCILAAEYGHLHILKFLEEYNYDFKNDSACDEAARNGDLMMLEWLINNGYPFDIGICMCAASGGHINIIKWLMD